MGRPGWTSALLGRLVRGRLAERLLVIGAYREDEAQEPRLAFAHLRRSCAVERIQLGGLGVEDMAALIGGAFESKRRGRASACDPRPYRRQPLHAAELARHVAEQPQGRPATSRRASATWRAPRRTAVGLCASVLAAAAVLGEAFDLPDSSLWPRRGSPGGTLGRRCRVEFARGDRRAPPPPTHSPATRSTRGWEPAAARGSIAVRPTRSRPATGSIRVQGWRCRHASLRGRGGRNGRGDRGRARRTGGSARPRRARLLEQAVALLTRAQKPSWQTQTSNGGAD